MKKLIAYFSYSNNTKSLVEGIAKEVPCDVVRIERVKPYSKVYDEVAYVDSKKEVQEKARPEIKAIGVNPREYDEILVFFPIWWYTFPMPVATFLAELKGYKGKVVFFENSYTNDPQYVVNSLRDAKEIDPDLALEQGLFNKSLSEHLSFLK